MSKTDGLGIPIVGESVWVGCPRGHVEHLRQPLTIGVGMSKPLTICRQCWLNFASMFAARELTPDELAEASAAGITEANG